VWTIEELVERVHAALSAEYPGAPNGRVRDLPDRRAVRWYATTGLVDRPAATRGRTALYTSRHLLQLVAVKRRQAAGRTLAAIQAELAGATDETLAAIARVPAHLLTGETALPETAPRTRFWADPAPAPALTDAAPVRVQAPTLTGVPLGDGIVLLLPGRPDSDDRDAITAAARPLLELLAARRLHLSPSEPQTPATDGSSS
jgi:DNA-binding transcriptional MerR regulator